jgi:predicted secreted Zn-dependent protease
MTDLSKVTWHRSSYCANSTCVEVARLGNQVVVRDSKDYQGRVLYFTRTEWNAFLDGVRRGEFDGNYRTAEISHEL